MSRLSWNKLNKSDRLLARLFAVLLLSDSDVAMRVDAVELLGQEGLRADRRFIKPFLTDPYEVLRMAALSSLARIGDRRDIPSIRKGLSDTDPVVRRYAIVALYDLLGAEAEPCAREMLTNEDDPSALLGAYAVLIDCGHSEYRANLEEIRDTSTGSLQYAALHALAGSAATPGLGGA